LCVGNDHDVKEIVRAPSGVLDDLRSNRASDGRGRTRSWQLEHRARTMVRGEFDFGFAVDLMRKDLQTRRSSAEV
jgi:3-hydroxyisobutyrate dehydrogenase-like beta-hydroxyacid dehydrogenase